MILQELNKKNTMQVTLMIAILQKYPALLKSNFRRLRSNEGVRIMKKMKRGWMDKNKIKKTKMRIKTGKILEKTWGHL
jgi:hypothetical protein